MAQQGWANQIPGTGMSGVFGINFTPSCRGELADPDAGPSWTMPSERSQDRPVEGKQLSPL